MRRPEEEPAMHEPFECPNCGPPMCPSCGTALAPVPRPVPVDRTESAPRPPHTTPGVDRLEHALEAVLGRLSTPEALGLPDTPQAVALAALDYTWLTAAVGELVEARDALRRRPIGDRKLDNLIGNTALHVTDAAANIRRALFNLRSSRAAGSSAAALRDARLSLRAGLTNLENFP